MKTGLAVTRGRERMDAGMWGGRAGGAGREGMIVRGWLFSVLQGARHTSPTSSPSSSPRAPPPAPQPVGMADVCAFLRGLSLLPASGSSQGCLSRARDSSEQS